MTHSTQQRGTQKTVLITSLVWAAVIAVAIGWFMYRAKGAARPPSAEGAAPLAEGPAVAPGSAESAAMPKPQQMEAPLAPVQLSDEQMQRIDLRTGKAEYKQIENDLSATGTVAIDDRRVAYVQTRFSGQVRRVFVNATYSYVRKGQPLFTIYSPELVATEREYLLARENQQALSGSPVGGVASGAGALAAAAEQRLAQWEIPASQIAELKRTGRPITDLTVEAPASGYVTVYNALPNSYATPETRLYTIADLSRVWVEAQVFQSDVGQLKPGETATVQVDSYPLRRFTGRIEEILPQVDLATRTVAVRLSIANPGLLLKPGMFVNVGLRSALGRRLVVPATAVFQTGTRQLVFLYGGGGSIEPRDVVLGPRVGDEFVVLKGIEAGQAIVTSADFLIDSESQLQAASGSYAPPPPGSGGAANEDAQNTAQAAAQMEMTTAPNPARKGANALTVKLTGAGGAALAGAEVTVRFYMPAMAAMGMAAMSATAQLTDSGGGVYKGSVQLGSGGTWQVTITARRGGETIATRQMHVQAEGGM